MSRRIELNKILSNIRGVRKVYFQPPETIRMEYPCIRYVIDQDHNRRANNLLYSRRVRYTVTVMDKDPDSSIPDALRALPYSELDRFYAADNLNHWVFSIYY